MQFEINFKLWKKVKEQGHCLCNLSEKCPCSIMIKEQKCKCGVFKHKYKLVKGETTCK